MRAATWRTGIAMRDQCGLTAMARSRGQAGAMAWQARSHAVSIWFSQSSVPPETGVSTGTVSSVSSMLGLDVFMVFS